MSTEIQEVKKMNELVKALAAAQGEFTDIAKDKTNPHFGQKYASLDAIITATRVPLAKHGLAVSTRFGDGCIEALLLHASGEQLSSGPVPLIVQKNDMQGLGSATTYARRYALSALLGIAPDEDDDGNAAAQAAPKQEAKKPASKSTTKPKAESKPKKSPAELIRECTAPTMLAMRLQSWLKLKPVKVDVAGWQGIVDEADAWIEQNIKAGKWTDAEADEALVVLKAINGQIRLEVESKEAL